VTATLVEEASREVGPTSSHGPWRRIGSAVLTILACSLVWIALVIPNELARLTPASLLRIPLEGLLIVGLLLLLRPAPRQAVGALVGFLLGLSVILKILDMGFNVAFARPFNPVVDSAYFRSAVDLLRLSVGRRNAVAALAVAGILVAVLLLLLPLAMLRVVRVVDEHRVGTIRAVVVLGAAWLVFAAVSLISGSGSSLAAASTASTAAYHVDQVRAGIVDERTFAEAAVTDPYRAAPPDRLLAGLRGKDVIVAFVESYGRVALKDPALAPGVSKVLDAGTQTLRAEGYSARTGYLTSSTFGGLSWLAHSTLQSGLLIDNQRRYDHLLATDRATLSSLFKRAGWRTAAFVPANERDWPEGRTFYGYDAIYDDRNMGYRGLKFGFATMPDQYIWSALHRLELARPGHAPVMAEVDLVSSHTPWAQLPQLVDWKDVGNGSIFSTMALQGPGAEQLWRDPERVKANYGTSIEYSLSALISYVKEFGSDNLVLVVLGDHQPARMVSGQDSNHDVPISVIARDPSVTDRLAEWGWTDGLKPSPDAPVWPMETFRDRFLSAFS
jgi:hypothetical protein